MTEQVIALGVALTVGLVWAIRQTGYLPDRLVPLTSVVIGSGWAWALGAAGVGIAIVGVQLGLMACGAWSGVKTTLQG